MGVCHVCETLIHLKTVSHSDGQLFISREKDYFACSLLCLHALYYVCMLCIMFACSLLLLHAKRTIFPLLLHVHC